MPDVYEREPSCNATCIYIDRKFPCAYATSTIVAVNVYDSEGRCVINGRLVERLHVAGPAAVPPDAYGIVTSDPVVRPLFSLRGAKSVRFEATLVKCDNQNNQLAAKCKSFYSSFFFSFHLNLIFFCQNRSSCYLLSFFVFCFWKTNMKMSDQGVLRPFEEPQIRISAVGAGLSKGDTVNISSCKIQLMRIETLAVDRVGRPPLTRSHTTCLTKDVGPGFKIKLLEDADAPARHYRGTMALAYKVPFFDVCSGEMSFPMDDGDTARVSVGYSLRVRLYMGAFSSSVTLDIPFTMALEIKEVEHALDFADPPAKLLEKVAQINDALERQKRENLDLAAAVNLRQAAPQGNQPDEGKNNNANAAADNDDDDDDDDDEDGVIPPEKVDDAIAEYTERLRKLESASPCSKCHWRVSDDKLRRKHTHCTRFHEHQQALDETRTLRRLVTHVNITLIDVATDKPFHIRMAPLASRDGLRWKIEELTARSVRSLKVLGSPLPGKSNNCSPELF